jgi:ribosomal-protein-alanine N-acetyltransferase
MRYAYRRMLEKDVIRVHDIEQSLFEDSWPVEHFLRDIRDGDQTYPYVLEVKNEIVGYVVCWYYAQEVHIGNIAVVLAHQRKGYGRLMLEKIIDMFWDSICIYLEVRETNMPAISLYQKYNFNILYRRKKYYVNGEDALVMVRYNEQSK